MKHYEFFLNHERHWLQSAFKKEIKKGLLFIVFWVIVGLVLLFSIIQGITYGAEAIIQGVIGGFAMAAIVLTPFVIFFLFYTSPNRRMKKIEVCVRELNLTEQELTEFSQEMLATGYYEFTQKGKNRYYPAKCVITKKYAYMLGGQPYVNIIRMDSISKIEPSSVKSVIGNSSIDYCIAFFCLGRKFMGDVSDNLPNYLMNFTYVQDREAVIELIYEKFK